MKAKRILVTGGSGFVGSRLVRMLVQAGSEVHLVVRRSTSLAQLGDIADAVTCHRVSSTSRAIRAAIAEARPDVVCHLASRFFSEHRPKDIRALIDANIEFGALLAEEMTSAGCRNLVNTGTSWQHFQGREYCPVNLYAATKKAYQDLLGYYVEARGLNVVTLELSDTYGPGDPRPKVVPLIRQAVRDGRALEMSPGDQLLALVHVDDVARAYIVASRRLLRGTTQGHETFSVAPDYPVTLRELIAQCETALDKEIRIKWGARPYRARETFEMWRGKRLPGWKPGVALADGLGGALS